MTHARSLGTQWDGELSIHLHHAPKRPEAEKCLLCNEYQTIKVRMRLEPPPPKELTSWLVDVVVVILRKIGEIGSGDHEWRRYQIGSTHDDI